MAKGAPIDRVTAGRFWALVNKGVPVIQAARTVGVSRSWAYQQTRGLAATGDSTIAGAHRNANKDKPPPRLDELDPVARDCLEDFGRFRARYLGSISVPWQEECAHRVVELLDNPEDAYAVVNCPQGGGKGFALDTPIPTPSGWTTMGDLRVGDEVFGADGRPCRVTYKSPVHHIDCYKVTFDDGEVLTVDHEHRWLARIGGYGKWKTPGRPDAPGKTGPKSNHLNGFKVYDTRTLARPRWSKAEIPMPAPLQFPEADLPVDPWVLGAWLGDGDARGGTMTAHEDDQPYMRAQFEEAGYDTTVRADSQQFGVRGLQADLRRLGVLGDKRIPDAYLRGSVDQRIALLQGLIDTDGSVDKKGRVEFSNKNHQIAEGVQFLVRSLGCKASLRQKMVGDFGPYYRLSFYCLAAARMPRKRNRLRPCVRTPNRYMAIEPTESVPTQCITVDSPDSLYLAGRSCVVTHNTRFFSHDLPAWITCRDRSVRGILGSLGLSMSHSLVGNLRDTLGRTVPVRPRPAWVTAGLALDAEACLADDYGRFKPTRSEGGTWSSDKLTVVQLPDDNGDVAPSSEKEPTWAGFSYEAKFLGWRVDFMVWDDLVNTQMLRNPDMVNTLCRWWDDEAESRLDPGGLCLLVGQRLRSNDIYRYALDKAAITEEFDVDRPDTPRMYQHFVFKAHYDERCQGEHGRDSEPVTGWDREGNATDGGCMLDPLRITWQKIKAKQVAGNYEVVYQQQDSDPSNVLVQKEWVNGGRGKDGVDYEGCWDPDRPAGRLPEFLPPGSSMVRYMTVDPSPTKFWACIDTLYVLPPDTERLAGYRYVIDLARKRMQAPDFLQWSRDQNAFTGLAEDWVRRAKEQGFPITHLIMERNAAQRWAMQYDFFRQWATSRGVVVVEHETTNNKSDPTYGVWSTLPQVYQFGRVRLPGDRQTTARLRMEPLVGEVTTYPDGATDDCVMSQWFGEYHLPNLIAAQKRTGSMYSDLPSWIAKKRDGIAEKVNALAYR